MPTEPVTDFAWYYDRAVGIAEGSGYAVDGRPTAYWPVGYPAFLGGAFAVFGGSVGLAKGLNTALTLLCAALAWVLARRLFDSPWVAHATGLGLALHPAYVAYSGILASEPLYTALLLAGVVGCLSCPRGRTAQIVAAGMAFGLATLVRPQAVVFPALVVAALAGWDAREAFRGRALATLGLLYGAAALTLLPWTMRNFQEMGGFVFVSTNGGDNLLIGHHPGATGRWRDPLRIEPRLARLEERDRDRTARSLALFYARNDPKASLRTVPEKLWATFGPSTDAAYWAFQTEPGRLIVPGADERRSLFLWFRDVASGSGRASLGIFVLGASSMLLARLVRRRRGTRGGPEDGIAAVAFAVVGATAVVAGVFFGNPRFGFPALPFMLTVGFGGVGQLVRSFRDTP